MLILGLQVEQPFSSSKQPVPAEPKGDPTTLAEAMLSKYGALFPHKLPGRPVVLPMP